MRRTVLLLCVAACGLAAAPAAVFAIRDARIVRVSGPALERGTVLIRDGLIEQVGPNVAIPPDAWVIEGKGLTVYPGLIDALSTLGIAEAATAAAGARTSRTAAQPAQPTPSPTPPTPASAPARGPEDRPSNTSWVRAADLVSPGDRRVETARSAGITTAMTFPQRGIFAGQGAVINLAGEKGGQMVVSAPAGLYLSVSSAGFTSFPGSLFGVMAYIRQIFLDADHYKLAKEAYAARPVGARRPAYDRALEGVLEAPRLLLPATRAVEVDRMVKFAAELKRPAVLYGVHEGYRATEILKKAGMPVLVSLKWPERSREADPEEVDALRILEMRERAPSTPAALAKAGVPFAFYTDGTTSGRDLPRAVRRALEAGLSQADAVRAFTLSAAEIYGVADRLGSLEAGKIANLVVTSGELFQEKTQVKHIFVDGMKFEPAPEPAEEVSR
ncbi:MAG: amidohydrolase family protein [Acidobacteria bacterium]|nr:amidohydrolase family protein [Acidobacteriota bacterium]